MGPPIPSKQMIDGRFSRTSGPPVGIESGWAFDEGGLLKAIDRRRPTVMIGPYSQWPRPSKSTSGR